MGFCSLKKNNIFLLIWVLGLFVAFVSFGVDLGWSISFGLVVLL